MLDVEALRQHLKLQRMNLLAHSAGAVLGMLYAAGHPEHIASLLLITPGMAAIGVHNAVDRVSSVAEHMGIAEATRAAQGLQRLMQGDLSAGTFVASRPALYARWDDDAQRNASQGFSKDFLPARLGYGHGLSLDIDANITSLAALDTPVLLYAGEADPLVTPQMVAAATDVFRWPTTIVQPGAMHFPWVDDSATFSVNVATVLDRFANFGIPPN